MDIKKINKKYFIFNSGSSITIRDGKNPFSDVIISDKNYDYDRCEFIIDQVYDYTGIDLIPNCIKLFDNINYKNNKKYKYEI